MAPAIIETKLIPPPLPPAHVARPRLSRLLSDLLGGRSLVWVCGTAGAGKTTAVVEATQTAASRLAWLTLDDTDAAPGRLLVYLEAALARVDPEAAGAATSALAAGIPHREAAGLLGAAVQTPTVLVIDELERLAGQRSSLAILSAIRRHARTGMLRMLLISRRDVALDIESRPADIAWVTEDELAFTVDEAASALGRAGAHEVDPEAAVEAVGGWVTGVLFEAWRSDEHVAGRGGEADPLNGYLATQILGALPPADVERLEICAVLDRIDATRAGRLGIQDADAWLCRLRTRHLPVTWGDHGLSLRFHPRLREYLLERLERRDRATRLRVRLRHGRLLADEGHHEEAAHELLLVGAHEEARASIETAIADVVDRLDFAIAELWLTSLGGRGSSTALTAAEVMLALGQEQYRRGAAVGDALSCAARDELVLARPGVGSMLAWCYFHIGRIEKVVELYEVLRDAPEGELVHELLTLADRDRSRFVITRRRAEPMDGLLLRLHWSHGRLRELDEAPLSRWAAAVGDPWRLAALRARGRLAEALEQLEGLRRTGELTGLQELIGAEVYIDAQRVDDARAAVARGRAKVELSGSAFLALLGLLIEVRLEIRLERNLDRARTLLDALDHHPAASCYRWITEQADALRGFVALLDDDDQAAVRLLRSAVASMVAGQRLLEIPSAAVHLAEAEWRAGDEDAADRAADLALETAERQGADHLLLIALADFPPVIARRIDAVPDSHSRWHALARALVMKGAVHDLRIGARAHLADFGPTTLMVDGEPRALRLTKSMELVAYLGLHAPAPVERRALLDALFEGRADKSVRSYLRQALREVRSTVPELIEEDDTLVRLRPGVTVASESLRFERSLAEAAGLRGEERLQRVLDSLELVRGEYLASASSAWVEQRREELRSKANQARYDAAELAYQFGRYAQADTLLRSLLIDDPLREEAWRLRVRLVHALADFDAVLETYRGCQAALATIGLEPAPSTVRLVEELRA